MDNEEILESLKPAGESRINEEEVVPRSIVKFLVFLIGERKLAVSADSIREIVLDLPLFYVPFVPSYVRGFINRHGEPYTVIDLQVLFDQQLLDSSTFLVMSDTSNPASFLISDVIEIMKVDEEEVHMITSRDDSQQYIMGSITDPEGREILILDIPEIFKRLSRDVAS